ncbi:unnamed protein product [Clonostachys rosea]|uniref:Amino acid permease/ SLC12A domain-containing protein n=1 Tax=Bionectria ochroleuca TaxID=29856 RepID=A0ABY6TZW1_BIOOC|nr:unnamed protein product [Clonostachys rosea]
MASPDGLREPAVPGRRKHSHHQLGTVSGVFIPVCLNILSILMYLRFGVILGQVGFVGILGLLFVAYLVNFLTLFSLSAIASNGEVKGGGPYYLISRSLGPEFGGSIGLLFFLAQVLNAALNIVGFIDCIRLNLSPNFPQGYWAGYGLQTAALAFCTILCASGANAFSKASNGLVLILTLSVVSIPVSAIFKKPFRDENLGVHFTGITIETLTSNFLPHTSSPHYHGLETFRDLFGILFPATGGILAGASMSGDLRNPSKAIPKGTLWGTLCTFIVYFVVILSLAASTTHSSLLANTNVLSITSLASPLIFAGECSVTLFSALMGVKSAAGLLRALAKDKLLPGLSIFSKSLPRGNVPIVALLLVHLIAQVALLAQLNHIATLISIGFQMTFLIMNLACFFLKVGSAPNFRPRFKFFSWQTAALGSLSTMASMFFIDETWAALAICVLIGLFSLIHYLCPPKRWGDVSQNLIYHQARKYLLRLKPEHIKFWRPHIILLVNNPRKQMRLIRFCNSLKKGSLYILGHVIVTDDFNSGVHEAKLQQQAWTNYISEFSRIKAFVQLTMSPSITWGVRNLILSAGLGGMRPNIAIIGFYNMDDLRSSDPAVPVPDIPTSIASKMNNPPKAEGKRPKNGYRDTPTRLLDGVLPTDVMRAEKMMSPVEYMTIVEDLALRYRLNTAVGYGFENIETPLKAGKNTKKYIDLWPIQMSAEITSEGKNILTTNFDTYTLILQLGHILRTVRAWKQSYKLRVMVFVEWESEVEAEGARVRELLDKLRIEATVVVLWLASGHLNTYELIVFGQSHDIDCEIMVNEALRDEQWWDDIQMFRGQYDHLTPTRERAQFAHILDSTSGRPGGYNPHEKRPKLRRRASVADLLDMANAPNVGNLTKLGANMGIHTHHLDHEIMDDASSGASSEADDEYDDMGESSEPDYSDYDHTGPRRETKRRRSFDPESQPLLFGPASNRGRLRSRIIPEEPETEPYERSAYGTLSTAPTQTASIAQRSNLKESSIAARRELNAPGHQFKTLVLNEAQSSAGHGLQSGAHDREGSQSPTTTRSGTETPRAGTITPARSETSRQSSVARSSTRPNLPLNSSLYKEVFKSGSSAATAFLHQDSAARPSASRQSSYTHARFSCRPTPDTKVIADDVSPGMITFAEQPAYEPPSSRLHSRAQSRQNSRPHSRQPSRAHSRQNSRNSNPYEGGISVDISSLLESTDVIDHAQPPDETPVDEGSSGFSGQSEVALSFNDLPSKAQHLIINELMRRHSRDTAVLLTTLPIPAEGTSQDELATIQYLSNIELLCNELPPTLMVLSNNMTVTISL